jgi:glycosyltransferase involved in cell wall biosynthesis
MKKLAIITTHPIQYYAPVFQLLSRHENVDCKVFYTLGDRGGQADHGFKKIVNWDIPLMTGYAYEFLENTAASPGTHHFKGIKTPGAIEKIKQWQPDAILVFGWASHSHLRIIRYFKGKVPVYFRGDSTLLSEGAGLKKALRFIFLKWVYRHVSHAFYVGRNNKAYYKAYGLKEAQLSFAPHAVDNERFALPRLEEADELRSSLKLNSDAILLLYAGKFEPVKNLPLLLKAFTALAKDNVHLLMVGGGVLEGMLKRIAAKSRLCRNIHFSAFKNQSYMPVLYQAADLVCLPSVSETWGLAVNEAMACSKAVLVSDQVGCAADLVRQDHNGNIFKSGDPDELHKYLVKLTESKDLLRAYGKNSGAMIRDWNFARVAEAIGNKLLDETN